MPSTAWQSVAEILIRSGDELGTNPDPKAYSLWKANVYGRVANNFTVSTTHGGAEVKDIDDHFWLGENMAAGTLPNRAKGRDTVKERLAWSAGIRNHSGELPGYPIREGS